MTSDPNTADQEGQATWRPGAVISRYTIVRRLGAGQMGEVYEARRTSDGSVVALKLTRASTWETEQLRRFHREANICGTIRHPNVVPVIDFGVFEGTLFLVMPVLRGHDLDHTLERTGALAPNVAVTIAMACGRGLAAAHDVGVIHRDFKPANVFLDESPHDGAITPIVCDFGVAKATRGQRESDITATGAVVGTPLYMSPEQLLDSKRVDERCDVWALGMTLYHMLAGKVAYGDDVSFAELLVALRDVKIIPLQSVAPWVPGSIARVTHAMMLAYEDRITTIAEAIEMLGKVSAPIALSRQVVGPLPPAMKEIVAPIASLPKSATELTVAEWEQSDESRRHGAALDATVPADPFLGRTLNERFRVVGQLGTGGMGAVYEAFDKTSVDESGAPLSVAVKVMLPGAASGTPSAPASDAVRRFLREAKAAARIDSPYVTRMLDSGVDEATGAPYIVMERLRGRDLGQLLRHERPLDPAVVARLFLDACSALDVAHRAGIVHRDLKPSNLFLHEEGDAPPSTTSGKGVVMKICDFGIAKQLDTDSSATASADLTRTGGLLGSPLYMSPEQAKSAKNVDARTDVYSLALSLHEALSGQRPWEGRTSMGEIIVAICTEDVPSLTLIAPWVPEGLAQAIDRGLARELDARTPSVRDFAAAIRPFALERPVRTTDLGALPVAHRSALPRMSNAVSSVSFRGNTGQPVVAMSGSSRSAPLPSSPAPRRSAILAIASALLLLIGVASIAAFVIRDRIAKKNNAAHDGPGDVTGALTAASPPPHTPISDSALVVPSSAPSASVVASASASAPPTTTKPITRLVTTTTTTTTIAPASSSAPPSAASSFGRGLTAPTIKFTND